MCGDLRLLFSLVSIEFCSECVTCLRKANVFKVSVSSMALQKS